MKPLTIELPGDLLEDIRREAREAGAAAARAVVEALPASPPPTGPRLKYARLAVYAERVGLSRRTLHDLVARGLPTVGEGRLRRVDVDAADEWLALHLPRRAAP